MNHAIVSIGHDNSENAEITYSAPSVWDRFIFFILLSGPPKLRVRDPNDSLDNIFDWVVILQVAAWALAGVWVVSRVWLAKPKLELKLSTIEKLSVLLVCCLSVSILFSEGPALTAFKLYQLLISILFGSVFVRCYGIKKSLECILFGCVVLCVADVIAAFIAPDMVFGESEFGSMRFRGDLIAQTGVVGTLGLVLFLCSDRKRSWMQQIAGIGLFGSVLVFSLVRTSYLAFIAFLLLALWKAPDIRLVRRFARWGLVALFLAILGGILSQLEEYRAAESVWTLSDRVGLWSYLIDTMWSKSPWFGLGYFSASRIYGPEYNVGLGTAHSVFVEVLTGGGIVSFSIFLLVWAMLLSFTVRLLLRPLTATSFTVVGLLVVTTSIIFIGAELEADPAGFTFWIVVASTAMLCRRPSVIGLLLGSKPTLASG